MTDERFYGEAAREIAEHRVEPDLFAKAYALALGDDARTRALYIGMRADRLRELHETTEATKTAEAQERSREKRPNYSQRVNVSQPQSVPKAAEWQPPKPENFANPDLAASVRAMLDALAVSKVRQ